MHKPFFKKILDIDPDLELTLMHADIELVLRRDREYLQNYEKRLAEKEKSKTKKGETDRGQVYPLGRVEGPGQEGQL